MFGISVTDVNEDGNLDILTVGNSYSTEPLTGYYDAGIGTCLLGDGGGDFKSVKVIKIFVYVRLIKILAILNLFPNINFFNFKYLYFII